ncbi:MAG: hypothetical protein ACKOZU_09520 [Planctomycetaceae bacterium]
MIRPPLAPAAWLPVAWLLAAWLAVPAAAAESAAGVNLGFGGVSRAGSWTPLVVTGLPAGEEVRVAVQDPDGAFVRSPSAAADGGGARFPVRLGRPAARVRVERVATGAVVERDLPPPLPSTEGVILAIGELPAVGRAARLLGDDAGTRIAVIGPGPGGSGAAVATARDLDGVDAVVACGRAIAGGDGFLLAGIDAWVRDGGRLVLAAGASAAALGGGVAAGWLPGPVEQLVPLRRVAAVEAHARGAGLAARPAAADLRVPLLANRAALAGAIDVFEGNSPTDLPLVVRRPHGLGSITWIGLDLDAEPFRGWSGTDTLLARLLGDRRAAAADRGSAAAGPPDLAGQLRLALEAPGADGGIAPVPFPVIAGLGLLYVACVFPVEWWLVSRSGRPWLAWLTLPAVVAAFTAAAWAAADRWRPAAGAGARAAEIVDIDAESGAVRGWSWLAAWRRDNARIDVAIAAGQGGDAAISWFADAGPGFGAIDATVAHPTLAAADYAYGDTLAALECVPVAAVSSRLFEARWSGTATDVVASTLARDGRGTLRGTVAHRLPFPLLGCRLAHGGWLWDVGDLAPGESHDLETGRGPRSLAGALARREAVRERETTGRWDRSGTDLAWILEVAGFHAAAGGVAYTGLEPGRLARLDLSPLLPLDRAVLVGSAAEPPRGWTTGWQVGDAGGVAGPEAVPCAARVYRIVIPLGAPSTASRAAGAPAE